MKVFSVRREGARVGVGGEKDAPSHPDVVFARTRKAWLGQTKNPRGWLRRGFGSHFRMMDSGKCVAGPASEKTAV
jgi:hypothetical protein